MSISLKNDAGTFSTNINQSNPTANVNITLPTDSGTVALTSDLKEIGINQTWQNVAASRASGTTYTNSTGKPIALSITGMGGNDQHYIYVNGVAVVDNFEIGGTDTPMFCIVPSGATYSATIPNIRRWMELR